MNHCPNMPRPTRARLRSHAGAAYRPRAYRRRAMPDNKFIVTFLPMLTAYGVRIVGVILAVWISLKIAGTLQRHVTNGLRNRRFDETLSVFFGSMLRWLIIISAVLACLSVFGIETTSFAAVIGAAGLAVG